MSRVPTFSFRWVHSFTFVGLVITSVDYGDVVLIKAMAVLEICIKIAGSQTVKGAWRGGAASRWQSEHFLLQCKRSVNRKMLQKTTIRHHLLQTPQVQRQRHENKMMLCQVCDYCLYCLEFSSQCDTLLCSERQIHHSITVSCSDGSDASCCIKLLEDVVNGYLIKYVAWTARCQRRISSWHGDEI